VGKGTKRLSEISRGSYLDAIGPIGNGFQIDKVGTAVIVAGGIGVAPLVALSERLRYLGSEIILYLGALKKDLFRPILGSRPDSTIEDGFANGSKGFLQLINNEFKEIGAKKTTVCTDDGSLGEKGLVSEILKNDIESEVLPISNATIYACGPGKMLRAVSDIAHKYKIPCQVLLEERMACGIGACLSCTCRVRGEKGEVERKRVCIDGPVFKSEDLLW
jgi:dihydroorotate dehydrogenase electron transfer subunit